MTPPDSTPTAATSSAASDRSDPRLVVVTQDGMGVAPGAEGRDGSRDPAELVEQPAKVMRIGTMVKQLLEEVRSSPLDEQGRARLAEVHRRSIRELEDGLAPELRKPSPSEVGPQLVADGVGAVQRDDAWRRHAGEHLAHVAFGDMLRVEREQALRGLGVHAIDGEGRSGGPGRERMERRRSGPHGGAERSACAQRACEGRAQDHVDGRWRYADHAAR